MTISLEGAREIKDDIVRSIDQAEKSNPELTGVTEGTSSVLLGTTGLLAIKSGIVRLANNEATYGGFGPVLTVAAGVASCVGAVSAGKRAWKCLKYVQDKKKTEKKD